MAEKKVDIQSEFVTEFDGPPPVIKKRWLGGVPDACEVCGGDWLRQKYFYDAATKLGQWAIMCGACHKQHGRGLGTGLGQKYDRKTLEKVEG